jgi:hypothetical protein
MPRKCLVCESQHLKEIDKALVDNESNRYIAKRFGLSESAVQRHKTNHLPKLLVKAKDAGEIVAATSLMDRVERVMARCEMIAETATQAKDWAPAIAASRELRGCLELLGKLNGEIQTGTKIGIAVNAAGSPVRDLKTMSNPELIEFLSRNGHPPILEGQSQLTEGDTP